MLVRTVHSQEREEEENRKKKKRCAPDLACKEKKKTYTPGVLEGGCGNVDTLDSFDVVWGKRRKHSGNHQHSSNSNSHSQKPFRLFGVLMFLRVWRKGKMGLQWSFPIWKVRALLCFAVLGLKVGCHLEQREVTRGITVKKKKEDEEE